MIFPSFFPGNLSGTWTGGQVTIDQPITILRIAATAKTPTGSGCPGAVFRFTDGTKGQDLVLAPGAYWSDSGPIVMTFAAGATLQSILRTGSTCASNTGADANLLVEYKMTGAGDTDTCPGTLCGTFCENIRSDPSNCGACGIACGTGSACVNGACVGAPNGSSCAGGSNCQSGICSGGVCSACAAGQESCGGTCINTQTDSNNCGACGMVCPGGQTCLRLGACVSSLSPNGAACATGATCGSGNCSSGVCCNTACSGNSCQSCLQAVTGSPNGVCAPATAGTSCGGGSSCNGAGSCVNQCNDNLKDGSETDVDCGGNSACVKCAIGKKCQVNTDCGSSACNAITLTCAASQCADNQKDGVETDIDCGGGICGACALGFKCSFDNDCSSNACNAVSLTCVANQCADNRKDGTETDLDCGGPNSCARCSIGKICQVNTDCTSNNCNPVTNLCSN